MLTKLVRGEDDYTIHLETDCGQALWRVELSNGQVVVQDDGRLPDWTYSAWLRLAGHLRLTGLSIRRLWLQFRSNHQRDILPANAEGYYFCKSVLGMLNSNQTLNFYIVGALVKGRLTVQRWAVPELVLLDTETRDPDKAGECLIRNP